MPALVIAHRTCPLDGPENSLAGITTAIEHGADVVELDVRRSEDGVPMLLHDRWLLRTTGWPRRLESVSSTWASSRRLRGGGTVPTFAEALTTLGPRASVAIDVKDGGAADAVIAEIRNQRLEERSLFWSQHEPAVRRAAETAPELEISLLRDTTTPAELDRFLADAGRFGAGGISAHWSQVGPSLADRCHQLGLRLYAWCRTESIDADKLTLLDGVVTDWPRAAGAAVAALDT